MISFNNKSISNINQIDSGLFTTQMMVASFFVSTPSITCPAAASSITFNSKNLSSIGTISCGAITSSGNLVLTSSSITCASVKSNNYYDTGVNTIISSDGLGNTSINALNVTSTLVLSSINVNYTAPGASITFNSANLSNVGNITSSGTINGNGGGLSNLNASNIATGTLPASTIPSLPYAQWRTLYSPAIVSSSGALTNMYTIQSITGPANIYTYRLSVPFVYNTNDKRARVKFAFNGLGSGGSTTVFFHIYSFNFTTMTVVTTVLNSVLCCIASGTNSGYTDTYINLAPLGLTNGATYLLALYDYNATAAINYKMAFPIFSIGSV